MIVRSYGERVSQRPVWAGRRDGLFVSSVSELGAVGRVLDILECEDVVLRGMFMTWVVDVEESKPAVPASQGTSDVAVTVHVPIGATCGLIVSR